MPSLSQTTSWPAANPESMLLFSGALFGRAINVWSRSRSYLCFTDFKGPEKPSGAGESTKRSVLANRERNAIAAALLARPLQEWQTTISRPGKLAQASPRHAATIGGILNNQ